MAGIGFELKKIFNNNSIINNIKGYFFTTIVTVGPFILIMTMLIFIQLMLKLYNKPYHYRELFTISVVYSFIFSQIISSGFAMIITRFVADKLYSKEYEDILASIWGVSSIALLIGFLIPIVFFWNSPLSLILRILTYVLYMQLIIMWLFVVFLSALKDYTKIFKSFTIGAIVAVFFAFLVIHYNLINIIVGLLLAVNTSILITLSLLFFNIVKFFPEKSTRSLLFLDWLDRFPSLFFINVFYTCALYIHNIIIWFSPMGRHIAGTYVYAPLYDVPTFYAFLSVIPSMTIFVVFVEVNFYDKYKKYLALITGKGNYFEITNAYKEMKNVLWYELTNLVELQLVFTFLSMILGNYFLPKIGITYYSLVVFNILTIGAYFTSIALIVIIVLLYFEDKKGAFYISLFFLVSNSAFNYISVKYIGPETYGFGFLLSSFLTLSIGLLRARFYLEKLDYHLFCSQPVFSIRKKTLINRFLRKIYGNY